MNSNLKKVISLIIFSISIVFMCFSVKAETTVSEDTLSVNCLNCYVTKNEGKTTLKFGSITPFVKKMCKENKGFILEIIIQVESLAKQYNPTTIIFDDVEYTYDAASATLTVTGYEGSVYATAYDFVLSGFNLIDESSLAYYDAVIAGNALDVANRSDKVFYSKEWFEIYYKECDRLKATCNCDGLIINPLNKIIIRGNVQRIGEGFAAIRSETCFKSYDVKVIDMSDSKVNMLYAHAFSKLKFLEKVILPATIKYLRISNSCFENTPLYNFITRSSQEFKDICIPVNKVKSKKHLCVVM